MTNQNSIFGLPGSASRTEVEQRVLELTASLSRQFMSARASEQAKLASTALRLAYEQLVVPVSNRQEATDIKNDYQSCFSSRLRLGQVCLASGMITLEQLEEAVKEQLRSDKQLGEILLQKQFISQEELDGLLIAQDLIAPEEEVTDALALQLMALGLVSADLMMIALIEQRIALSSVGEVLLRHGWIEPEILQALAQKSS